MGAGEFVDGWTGKFYIVKTRLDTHNQLKQRKTIEHAVHTSTYVHTLTPLLVCSGSEYKSYVRSASNLLTFWPCVNFYSVCFIRLQTRHHESIRTPPVIIMSGESKQYTTQHKTLFILTHAFHVDQVTPHHNSSCQ